MNCTTYLLIVLTASAWLSPVAHAATCQVTGTVKIQSLDSYYCTSPMPNCGAWKEVHLQSNDRPLKYMEIHVYSNGMLIRSHTDANGAYTALWTQASCPSSVAMEFIFNSVIADDFDEADPRVRFFITDTTNNATHVDIRSSVPLVNGIGTKDMLYKRTAGVPNDDTKYANVYYTMNSAALEMASWHSSIASALSKKVSNGDALQVRYNPTDWNEPFAGFFVRATNELWLAPWLYNNGSTIRHELGHAAQNALHSDNQSIDICYSYDLGDLSPPGQLPGHGFRSCEWGYAAMYEGIANFLGVRSVTTSDRAFACQQSNNGNQAICSQVANNMVASPTPDRVTDVPNGMWFYGVGDTYASASSHCTAMTTAECGTCYNNGANCSTCSDGNSDGTCDYSQSMGFRNEVNVARFLWDMVDAYNAPESADDTQLDMDEFADMMHDEIDCDENQGYGVDGSCNEAEIVFAPCAPSSAVGLDGALTFLLEFGGLGSGSRDSYNPYDFAEAIDGDQSAERSLNCVNSAAD